MSHKFKLGLPLLAAIAGMVMAFSFNTTNAKQNQYYWFPLDVTTGNPQTVTTLVYQSTGPFGCTIGSHYCDGGYSAYIDNGDGTYSASGTREITEMKN
ncbi:MAG: hypothetical protein EPN39_12195 [Chitinophagaceae bacterium]|jgi:hypothetical protein|nr:MAG: hypothetical protein EPN39_12195 [Chitinophagaceae bacterium]